MHQAEVVDERYVASLAGQFEAVFPREAFDHLHGFEALLRGGWERRVRGFVAEPGDGEAGILHDELVVNSVV